MQHASTILAALVLSASALASPVVGTNDNDCTTATTITSGANVAGTVSFTYYSFPTPFVVQDRDWYRVVLQPGETMSVLLHVIQTTHGDAYTFDLDTYDGGTGACPGTQVSSSRSPILHNSTTSPRDYYLSVYTIGVPWSNVTYELLLHISPILDGAPYCVAGRNSTTVGADLTIQGTTSVAADNLQFVGVNLPNNTMALLFDGSVQVPLQTFGDGYLCTGGTMNRLRIYPGSASGVWNWPLGNSSLPAVATLTVGTTTNFQLWYRDVGGPGGSGFNLSSGVQVTFSP